MLGEYLERVSEIMKMLLFSPSQFHISEVTFPVCDAPARTAGLSGAESLNTLKRGRT